MVGGGEKGDEFRVFGSDRFEVSRGKKKADAGGGDKFEVRGEGLANFFDGRVVGFKNFVFCWGVAPFATGGFATVQQRGQRVEQGFPQAVAVHQRERGNATGADESP